MSCALIPRLRARMRDQRGVALIEVMVSAMLIAIVAVGVFAGLDAAGNTSGNTKARGVAASIAQEDQERLRGLQISDLIEKDNEVRTVTIANVPYTVRTGVEAVSDDGAASGCTSSNVGIDYFKVSTAVTWTGLGTRDPVAADTLITPKAGSFAPGEGGLVVQVRDRNGDPLSGHTVSISGPSTGSDVTDTSGCAFFAYIPMGAYTMTISSGGFVTPAGDQNVVKSVSVPDGALSTVAVDYDRAGDVRADVKTLVGASLVADLGRSIVVAHSGVPAPGWRLFPDTPLTTPAASITTSDTLFPFTSPYTVYAGSCSAANPANYGVTTVTPTPVALPPNGNQVVTVEEPRLYVLVRRVSSSSFVNANGAGVWVTDMTCGGDPFSPGNTNSSGRLVRPGLPYGIYKVCAEYNYGGSIGWRHSDENSPAAQKSNTARAGVADYTLQVGSPTKNPDAGQPPTLTGRCPQ